MRYQRKARRALFCDATILDFVGDEEASSERNKRSPTDNSFAKTKRPNGRKFAKEKGKKTGDDDIKKSVDAIMSVRRRWLGI
jgi:hypothetical protein